MLNESELYQMIHSPEESWRLEKTIGLKDTTKFGEAICSFANDLPDEGMPGYLLIGVDKHNKIAGMQLDESIEQNLLDFSKDGRIIPAPVIMTKLFHLVEGDVCVAKVLPSTHTPLRFNGKICVRKGPRKDYANEQEEKILIEKRNRFGHTFDIQPCLNATLEDVDTKSFSLLYLPLAIDSETLEVNHRPMELQMSSLQFYSSRHHVPTHAGIIMLAYKPTHFIPGAAIQYVKFDGQEIFADDVKCSHGCTIGQLDESAMFYMQQRGIPKKEAKALLMFAFSNEVIESIKIPELKQRISKIIATKLGVNLGFDL